MLRMLIGCEVGWGGDLYSFRASQRWSWGKDTPAVEHQQMWLCVRDVFVYSIVRKGINNVVQNFHFLW